jgi:2-amino-4-hydroxy-6-hydroxymethyldihydropteridine diphosphokinase
MTPLDALTHLATIALGSNLGDRAALLNAALQSLAQHAGIRLLAASSFHETQPVGPVPQGPFLNAAAAIHTSLAPLDLLRVLLEIERVHGRDRRHAIRWGPRSLDLDLLTYDQVVTESPDLQVPHPRLKERLFVLEPLAEIMPDLTLPDGSVICDLRDSLRTQTP